jgi:sec-independent protein translocase protein TatB
MKIFNLGLPEIILIIVLALIVMGPGNMVKTAREIGAFLRKVTKSPYWQEIWATKRELTEIPKILAKEADIEGTMKDLEKDTKGLRSSVASTMSDLIKEVDEPLKEVDKELKSQPVVSVSIPGPEPEEERTIAPPAFESDKKEGSSTAEKETKS